MSGGCSGWRGNVLAVGNCCYVAVCSAARGAMAPTGGEGRGHIAAASAYSLYSLQPTVCKNTDVCACMWTFLPNTWQELKWKKALGEMQTLRAGHSNAEPKIFTLPQTPSLGVQDCQNLISWRWSLPASTDPVWWKSMHAISSYRGNRHCPHAQHKQKHTDRTDYNTLRC